MVGQEVRQVFDLPMIALQVVEHCAQRRRCGCGHLTAGVFPDEATAPTCYGPGVAALGTYTTEYDGRSRPAFSAKWLANDITGAA